MRQDIQELEGNISQFPVFDIIQFLGMTGKCGELVIYVEKEKYSLFFDCGIITHGLASEEFGSAAVLKIVSLKDGNFNFVSGNASEILTINKKYDILLLDCQRHMDELNDLREKMPPSQTVISLQKSSKDIVSFTSEEWNTIVFINGKRSISSICRKTRNELSARRSIYNLMVRDLITTGDTTCKINTVVPRVKDSSKINEERPYPPMLQTNLLLNAIDGRKNAEDLAKQLSMTQSEIVEELILLTRTNWIEFCENSHKAFEAIINDR